MCLQYQFERESLMLKSQLRYSEIMCNSGWFRSCHFFSKHVTCVVRGSMISLFLGEASLHFASIFPKNFMKMNTRPISGSYSNPNMPMLCGSTRQPSVNISRHTDHGHRSYSSCRARGVGMGRKESLGRSCEVRGSFLPVPFHKEKGGEGASFLPVPVYHVSSR